MKEIAILYVAYGWIPATVVGAWAGYKASHRTFWPLWTVMPVLLAWGTWCIYVKHVW